MNVAEMVLSRGRVVVSTVLCLALAGLAAWWSMPRQEDPDLLPTWGQVLVVAPGHDPVDLERLVAVPMERELMQIVAMDRIFLTVRPGVVAATVVLDDTAGSLPDAWTQVRETLDELATTLPEGVQAPTVDDQQSVTNVAVFALTGAPAGELREAARTLQRRLQRVPGTRRVQVVLDPGEEVLLPLAPEVAWAHGIAPGMLAEQVAEAGRIRPAGSLESAARVVRLHAQMPFTDTAALRALPIRLPGGDVVALESLAEPARRAPAPPSVAGRWNGEPALFVAVTPRTGVHAVDLGDAIMGAVEEVRPTLGAVQVHTLLMQSEHVERRLGELTTSLAQGIGLLALLLLLALGLRAGLVVSISIPIVVLVALGLYAIGGGVLHQISIAAFVLALGLVVDNAIVLTEAIERRMREGLSGPAAARRSVAELAMPLFAATGTTIAAFVPMLLATGDTATFTGAIPVVVILSLTVSWVLAVTFVPVVAAAVLPRRKARKRTTALLPRLAGRAAVQAPWAVLATTTILLALVLSQTGRIGQQFFPASDRASIVVDLQLPEGSPLAATDAATASLSNRLLEHPDTVSVAAAIGEGLPRFYYNIIGGSVSPHTAQLLVETRTADHRHAIRHTIRNWAAEHPHLVAIDRVLAQGPPTGAPIEVRLLGDDEDALLHTADRIRELLASLPTVRHPLHDAGPGLPTLRTTPNDAALLAHGLDRSAIGHTLLFTTAGLPAGELLDGEERIPIRVRTPHGSTLDPAALAQLPVFTPAGDAIPLAELAHLHTTLDPAVIHRYNQQQRILITAELADNAVFSDVVSILRQHLPTLVPPHLSWELGGEAEGAEEASAALLTTLPLGIALLLFFLLVQFNSLRRLAIIFVTVPLAATGVIPGLLLLQQPFGFMALLGVLAVVGIVVNNAIVLISVIDDERRAGLPPTEAIRAGLDRRWRAVLLTTATTILGLLPLAITPSPLWPPLATAMISGIGASALLTLFVVPALYRLLASGPLPGTPSPHPTPDDPTPHSSARPPTTTNNWTIAGAVLTPTIPLALMLSMVPAPAMAATPDTTPLTFEQAIARAADRPAARADDALRDAAAADATAARRAGRMPQVGARLEAVERSAAVAVTTPGGALEIEPRRELIGGADLVVPLWQPAAQFDRPAAAHALQESAESSASQGTADRRLEAADAWLHAWVLARERTLLEAQRERLVALRDELGAAVAAGAAAARDVDRVTVEIVELDVALLHLDRAARTAADELGRVTGLDGSALPTGDPPAGGVAHTNDAAPTTSAELGLRAQHAALHHQAEAARIEARAIRRDALPTLHAEGRWRWTSREAVADPHRLEAALVLRWEAWAGGARRHQADALHARADAVEAQAREELRADQVRLTAARAAMEAAEAELELRSDAVAAAERWTTAERLRHTAGAAVLGDLLDAELALRRAETRRTLAQADLASATAHWRWVTGAL